MLHGCSSCIYFPALNMLHGCSSCIYFLTLNMLHDCSSCIYFLAMNMLHFCGSCIYFLALNMLHGCSSCIYFLALNMLHGCSSCIPSPEYVAWVYACMNWEKWYCSCILVYSCPLPILLNKMISFSRSLCRIEERCELYIYIILPRGRHQQYHECGEFHRYYEENGVIVEKQCNVLILSLKFWHNLPMQ